MEENVKKEKFVNLSESSRPANPVQIGLAVCFSIDIHRQVKVHHNCHLK